jgi:hypothetical protein
MLVRSFLPYTYCAPFGQRSARQSYAALNSQPLPQDDWRTQDVHVRLSCSLEPSSLRHSETSGPSEPCPNADSISGSAQELPCPLRPEASQLSSCVLVDMTCAWTARGCVMSRIRRSIQLIVAAVLVQTRAAGMVLRGCQVRGCARRRCTGLRAIASDSDFRGCGPAYKCIGMQRDVLPYNDPPARALPAPAHNTRPPFYSLATAPPLTANLQ